MSINIQLEGGLKKLSGQQMSKDKIVDQLGYTPANENTVNIRIAELDAGITELTTALENYIKNHPDIVEDGSGEVVFTDEAGNIIAKFDNEGLHTTDIEAESFISKDNNLIINDTDGNIIFKVDEAGVRTTKLELNSGDIDEQFAAQRISLAEHTSDTAVHVTNKDKEKWNNKSDFSGDYHDLVNAPAIEDDGSGEAVYADPSGNVIAKIDAAGIHTTKLELSSGDIDSQFLAVNATIAAHASNSNTEKHVTSEDITKWNNKSDFSGDFHDLKNSPITEDNSGELVYTDESGNIIFKINNEGAETTELKLSGGKVDERIQALTAEVAAHTSTLTSEDKDALVHITPAERDLWNTKVDAEYVNTQVANLVNAAPEELDTLKELADALGNDENFAATVTSELSKKALAVDLAEHTSRTDIHITAAERATWNDKSDVKSYYDLPDAPDIKSDEDDSLLVADPAGNIVFKAGKLNEDTTGVETTTIKAQVAQIGNVYTKGEIDAFLADKSDDDHTHTITAVAEDDDVVILEGTSGTDGVSYKATHVKPSELIADTYTKVAVNEYGHVTSGSKPENIADLGITNVYTKDQVDATVAEVESKVTQHETDTNKALADLKAELSEEIVSESDSWNIVDGKGNILLKAGKLDDDSVGLETTKIIAEEAVIDNIYNKTEVDSIVAEKKYNISAGASDDDVVILTGTGGDNSVSYTATHADSGVTAGTYKSVTVDAKGHITAGTNPNTLEGFGITDAYTDTEVNTLLAEHIGAATAHTKDQVGLGNVDNTADLDKPISTATQSALDALKEEIVTESDYWTVADGNGNVLLKAGELDDNKVGLETTTIIADEAIIDNIYNKTEVDTILSEKKYAITANADDDDVVILEGTSGQNTVSYKATHAKTNKAGTYRNVTVNEYGHVVAGSNPTTLAGYAILDAYTITEVDSKIAEHTEATNAHTPAQVGLGNVNNTADLDKPISTKTQAAIDALKEEIVSESDSWTVADKDGNILVKAGKLDDADNTIGIETTTIIAETAKIGNIYNKTEVDTKIAEQKHDITANADDDDVIILTGTGGENEVSYSASHADSGVTATTNAADSYYTKVKVNAKGHITSGSKPTAIADLGITNVYTKGEVDSALAEKANTHSHPYLPDSTNYAGSASQGGPANSVAKQLKIQLNSGTTEGTNQFTFDGSVAKTLNITPSAIDSYTKGEVDAIVAPLPNQNAFSYIKVDETTIGADNATDTVTFIGDNITITPNLVTDEITFEVASGSTDTPGIVQLEDSVTSDSTTKAATPKNVKAAYDKATEALQKAAEVEGKIPEVNYPVTSVNNKTGAVVLTATDVQAVPNTRKVNNKVLSTDIELGASDVGAISTSAIADDLTTGDATKVLSAKQGVAIAAELARIEGKIPAVVDNLETEDATKALSAKQGKELSDAINSITTDLGNLGGGDMMKATYDKNNNGIVDNSEKLEGHTASYFATAAKLAEVEAKIPSAEDISHPVTSVNGQTGDVNLSIPSITGLASETYVNTKIAEVEGKIPTIPEITHPVTSVNGKTGAVTLDYSDVGTYSTGEIDQKLATKLDKNLGTSNKNKILSTDNSGAIVSTMSVDSSLSGTSTNPVQNSVVKSALDGKLGTAHNTDTQAHQDIRNAIITDYTKLANAPSINENEPGTATYTDEAGNIIALIDNTGLETTKVTAESLTIKEAGNLIDVTDTLNKVARGYRLISPDEIAKLAKLVLEDGGGLALSGTVNAENVIGLAALLANKVDVAAGKGLSTNDFTNSYKEKLDNAAAVQLITWDATD